MLAAKRPIMYWLLPLFRRPGFKSHAQRKIWLALYADFLNPRLSSLIPTHSSIFSKAPKWIFDALCWSGVIHACVWYHLCDFCNQTSSYKRRIIDADEVLDLKSALTHQWRHPRRRPSVAYKRWKRYPTREGSISQLWLIVGIYSIDSCCRNCPSEGFAKYVNVFKNQAWCIL